MDQDARAFRERSITHLRRAAQALTDWLGDWQESDADMSWIQPKEYPFTVDLEEQIARIHRCIEMLEREECFQCGLLVADPNVGSDHAYNCEAYLPKHRAVLDSGGFLFRLGSTIAPVAPQPDQHKHEIARRLRLGEDAADVARGHFRRMVIAFAGGYHPDTTQYVRPPFGYTQERINEIEEMAQAVGLDLYTEALAVTREGLS